MLTARKKSVTRILIAARGIFFFIALPLVFAADRTSIMVLAPCSALHIGIYMYDVLLACLIKSTRMKQVVWMVACLLQPASCVPAKPTSLEGSLSGAYSGMNARRL